VADLDVLQELQTYLVAQGIGVVPFNPKPADGVQVTTIWTYPRDGAALPRNIAKVNGVLQGETTVTLVDTNLRSPSSLEPWMQEAFVDVIVRSPQAFTGKLVQRAICALIAPGDLPGGRHQWMMGALLVETSTEWRGDQPLPQRQAVGESDSHATYDRIASYRFQCRRKILAGTTFP
jgi:hypothetical protein